MVIVVIDTHVAVRLNKCKSNLKFKKVAFHTTMHKYLFL